MKTNNKFLKRLAAAKRAFMTEPPKTEPSPPAAPPEPKFLVTLCENPETVLDLKPQYCCGCGACANVCPANAIKMEADSWGYFRPVIDSTKCTECTLCAKTCPVINTPSENAPEPECFAVMGSDELRRKSSSGGMFTLLAEYVLEKGGYVCGAVLTENFEVEHVIIDSPEKLERLRGSKYVQSNTKLIYREIKKLLDGGKTVMFTGTPCQAAGLSNFLRKKYDNLIIVDLVCHGAPSQKVFKKYISEKYGIENLSDFKFRTKEFGYSSFNQTAYMKDGSKISGNFKFDYYEKAMHTGIGLKDICGDCMFAPAPRQGDISIGDFWGISRYNKEFNDNLGTSCVLANTPKGKELIEAVRDKMKLFEPVPYTFARQNNRFGRRMNIPSGRRWFYNMLDKQPFEKAVDYALNRKFDVGVIGLWFGRNYGSMATYYALHYVLKSMGLSILMIENCLKPASENDRTKTHPRRIADDYYDVSLKYSVDDLQRLNANCDTFIVGSDQLWNIYLSRPYRQTYFLGFVNEMNKKIAYGTSFGIDYRGTPEELMVSSNNLKRFDHVSVRDDLSEGICRDKFGVEATQVCDPTFLCPIEGYEELIEKAGIEKQENYILAYILDPNKETGEMLCKIAKEKKTKVYIILDEPPHLWEGNLNRLELPEECEDVRVIREVNLYEWLWYYKNSDSVITDSFHGTIFSVIFERPFMTITNQRRGAERFISLLKPLGLTDRLFENSQKLYENADRLENLDYTESLEKLAVIRENSRKWLENAIFSPKKFKSERIYGMIDKTMEEKKNEI